MLQLILELATIVLVDDSLQHHLMLCCPNGRRFPSLLGRGALSVHIRVLNHRLLNGDRAVRI